MKMDFKFCLTPPHNIIFFFVVFFFRMASCFFIWHDY